MWTAFHLFVHFFFFTWTVEIRQTCLLTERNRQQACVAAQKSRAKCAYDCKDRDATFSRNSEPSWTTARSDDAESARNDKRHSPPLFPCPPAVLLSLCVLNRLRTSVLVLQPFPRVYYIAAVIKLRRSVGQRGRERMEISLRQWIRFANTYGILSVFRSRRLVVSRAEVVRNFSLGNCARMEVCF